MSCERVWNTIINKLTEGSIELPTTLKPKKHRYGFPLPQMYVSLIGLLIISHQANYPLVILQPGVNHLELPAKYRRQHRLGKAVAVGVRRPLLAVQVNNVPSQSRQLIQQGLLHIVALVDFDVPGRLSRLMVYPPLPCNASLSAGRSKRPIVVAVLSPRSAAPARTNELDSLGGSGQLASFPTLLSLRFALDRLNKQDDKK